MADETDDTFTQSQRQPRSDIAISLPPLSGALGHAHDLVAAIGRELVRAIVLRQSTCDRWVRSIMSENERPGRGAKR
jgi:hypothetical protein